VRRAMPERGGRTTVPAVAPTASATRNALEDGGEFAGSAWVACRTGLVQNHLVPVRSESPG
jgi:hypothetical protein